MIDALLQADRLLLHGMLDQAEELYRRTAEQDPRNAIAVVGLARVCLERGDDEGALAHASAALTIDPENNAAIRLELRLTEVLAERAGDQHAAARAATPPAWSSTASPLDPSEQAVFARNRSMADHRTADPGPTPPGPTQPAEPSPQQAPTADVATRPRRLIDRLLGRNRRS